MASIFSGVASASGGVSYYMPHYASHSLSKILLCCLLLAGMCSAARAQVLWLEPALAYRERVDGSYAPRFKIGLRGVWELNDTVGLYTALAYRDALLVDAGAWFSFPLQRDDPFGFRAYAGIGLSYATSGDAGLALNAAISYALTPGLDLALVYTHRPIVLPEWAQAFDIALGLRIALQ